MTKYIAVSPQLILDVIEECGELKLDREFRLSSSKQLLTLCYKNKAVVIASVWYTEGFTDGPFEVQIGHVLNADLDISTDSSNVVTLAEAGAVIRKAFEKKQYQINSQF